MFVEDFDGISATTFGFSAPGADVGRQLSLRPAGGHAVKQPDHGPSALAEFGGADGVTRFNQRTL
ncbi:MAG: hypothetical protein CR217_19350 [Beijerinckiaceae bacterium]|nr:MAG: hypothetical protein CR217_19350 [Beijerinckiaceae bacterium]